MVQRDGSAAEFFQTLRDRHCFATNTRSRARLKQISWLMNCLISQMTVTTTGCAAAVACWGGLMHSDTSSSNQIDRSLPGGSVSQAPLALLVQGIGGFAHPCPKRSPKWFIRKQK
jgi:hypothetical protein